MSYTHLAEHDRYVLGHQHAAGWSLARIAESIGRYKGTINRELRRHQIPCYETYDSNYAGGPRLDALRRASY